MMNPLFVPPLVLGLIGWLLGNSAIATGWIVGLALLFYTLIPLAATYYLIKTRKITSWDLPVRQSRDGLFIYTIASATLAFWGFLIVSSAHQLISLVSLVFLINALVGFGINRFWKMSIHAAGLASASAIFLFFSQHHLLSAVSGTHILSLFILLLLLPLMIWARYRLNVHTFAELIGGTLAGFLLTILELSILTAIW